MKFAILWQRNFPLSEHPGTMNRANPQKNPQIRRQTQQTPCGTGTAPLTFPHRKDMVGKRFAGRPTQFAFDGRPAYH
jgi:hypothetical protein